MTGGASREKGKLFERQVAKFLEKQGWEPTLGQHFDGKIAIHKHDCDIFAKKTNVGWTIVAAACLSSVAMVVAYWFGVLPAELQIGSSINLLAIGFLLGPIAAKRSTRYVWIECKNLQQSIKRDLIMKLKDQFRDTMARRGSWECWLVSTSRFDEDAIAHAKAHRVTCFQVIDPGGRSMALHEVRSTTGDV
jgi:hypothetical protein